MVVISYCWIGGLGYRESFGNGKLQFDTSRIQEILHHTEQLFREWQHDGVEDPC